MLLDRVYFFKKIFLSTFSNRMWFEYVSDSLRVASYSLTYGWDTFYYIKTFGKNRVRYNFQLDYTCTTIEQNLNDMVFDRGHLYSSIR
jgi:hypothetical protein